MIFSGIPWNFVEYFYDLLLYNSEGIRKFCRIFGNFKKVRFAPILDV